MNRLSFGRVLAMIISVVGLATSIVLFITFWLSPEASRLSQLHELVNITHGFLQFAITLIIVWRGGAHAPNVALALAIAFVSGNDVWTLFQLHVWPDSWLLDLGAMLLFWLAASLFILSAQRFPRAIGPADVIASPTMWGRIRALRAAVILLLRPWAVWVVTAVLTSVLFALSNAYVADVVRIAIVLLGILYFYITFRSGDANARAKVLWFLQAVVAFLVLLVVAFGVRAVLGDAPAHTLRASISLVLNVLNSIILTTCFAAAVFYAGAIDPGLVIRKTMVIGASVTMLLFAFAALEHYLVHLLVHGAGVTNSLATAVMGALLGYAFHPLKHRVEQFLKRFAPAKAARESRSAS